VGGGRRSRWLTLLLASSLVTGCIPSDPIDEGAAIQRSGDQFIIVFVRCGECRPSEIKIRKVEPGQGVVPEDAPVVWQVAWEKPRR
jgi:hypothetical protein